MGVHFVVANYQNIARLCANIHALLPGAVLIMQCPLVHYDAGLEVDLYVDRDAIIAVLVIPSV